MIYRLYTETRKSRHLLASRIAEDLMFCIKCYSKQVRADGEAFKYVSQKEQTEENSHPSVYRCSGVDRVSALGTKPVFAIFNPWISFDTVTKKDKRIKLCQSRQYEISEELNHTIDVK